LYPTSSLSVQSYDGVFKPTLVLNGDITVKKNTLELDPLVFQNLTFISESPYVTAGLFSLTNSNTDTNRISNFPLHLEAIQFGFTQDQKPVLDVVASLTLGSGDNSFSVQSGARIVAKITKVGDKREWELDQAKIKDILIEVKTTPFYLKGIISHCENDPIYGNGFFGLIEFGFP